MLSFIRVFVFSWLAFTVSAITLPILKTRDVIDPPITNPNASTVWTVGSTQLVVWDTSNIPPASRITNPVGQVILGFLDGNGENLMLDSPLAKGFDIRQGSVQVTVPNVPDRSNYIVVLMGDSGNASPKFTITGGGSSSPSPSPSSSSAAPTSTSSNALGPGATPESSPPVSGDASRPSPSPSSPSDHGSGFALSVSSNYVSSTSTSTSGTSASTSTSGTPTSSSPPSSTVVVVSSTSRPTATTTTNSNGAASNHSPVNVACFSLVLVIAGLLL